jgi:hypothetical protein
MLEALMTLRWWLLSVLLSAATISSLHLWRHRHRPEPDPVVEPELEEIAADLPAPRRAHERPPAPRPVHQPAATGMATVHGRILGAQESGEDTEKEITLIVSDEEENETDVTVEADGSFSVELAPGTYSLHAELEDMMATLDAVTVGAEEDKEVVLQLTEAAAIKGTLRPPNEEGLEELSARFEIRPSGEDEWSESEGATVEGQQFTVTGLEAGKRYDVLVTVDGFRPVELTGIAVPSAGHVIDLVRPARLRGGFGIARGEKCPISEVTIVASDEQTQVVMMDHFCRFEADTLPPAPRVRVQVSEGDWSFDMLVDIPPHSDPPFLCLHSQCREPAFDELSTLEISLTDSPDRTFWASIVHDHSGVSAHAAKGEAVRFSELPSGATTTVSVYARSCQRMVQSLVLAPGVNRLSLTCQKT